MMAQFHQKKNGTKAYYTPTLQDIADKIKEIAEPGDLVLSIGAGNITHLADLFEDVKEN